MGNPLGELRDLHREILADPVHNWGHLLGALSVLLDLPGELAGAGTSADPWRVEIAAAGPVHLQLAAWNARDSATPAAEQRLRLGLRAEAQIAPFTTVLLSEVLAIDLPAAEPGRVELVGRQQVRLTWAPIDPVELPGDISIAASAITAQASWRPGAAFAGEVRITDVVVAAGAESFGPLSWTLPGVGPDLGAAGIGVLRLLAGHALQAYGGYPAFQLGGLLGLHRSLPDLPADWPVLEPVAGGDIGDLLADPRPALREQLRKLATGTSQSGEAHAVQALQLLGSLLGPSVGAGLAGAGAGPAGAGAGPAGAGLAGAAGAGLAALVPIGGSGTADDPWTVPLAGTGDADPAQLSALDALAWLEPDGPPVDWLASLAQQAASITAGPQFTSLLQQVATVHPALASRLAGRELGDLGAALDELSAWLLAGDGVVPLAAQQVAGGNWSNGTTLAAPHQLVPRDPGAIAQVAAQLTAWTAGSVKPPVVLVSAPFADRSSWSELLSAVAPGHSGAAHFGLRAVPNPADVDLATVTAVSGAYTVELLAGAPQSEQVQLERVVRRVLALTGAPKVVLVAHSTSGLVARCLAAQQPQIVAGLITLATPHGGSDVAPLTDGTLAAAVRVAASVVGPIADSAVGATIAQLAAALDGVPGPLGRPIPIGAIPAIAGLPAETVPGLAVGSTLVGDIMGLLAGSAIADAGRSEPARGTPTHLAFGLRTALAVPAAAPGEIALSATARIDLGRVGLQANLAPTATASTRIAVELLATRPGGWLIGSDNGAGPRVRWLATGAAVDASAPGAVAGRAWLRLHEAGVAGSAAGLVQLGDPQLAGVLDPVLELLGQADPASAAGRLMALLRAAGIVLPAVAGPPAFPERTSLTGIEALVAVPARTLAERRDALLGALRAAAGWPAGGVVTLPLGSSGLELSLDLAAEVLRLHTPAAVNLAAPLTGRIDVRVSTRTLSVGGTAQLRAGVGVLRVEATGQVTVELPPWLSPVALRPFDRAGLERALTELVPQLAVSGVISGLLGERVAATIGPVDLLLRDPRAWLLRDAALGSGGQLDGTKVNDLLKAVAELLGLDATSGLHLPGDYLLHASGSDPLRLALAGSFGDAAVATLEVDAAVEIRSNGQVTPAAAVSLDLALPGDWGRIAIAFSLTSTGVGLVVTPQNTTPIRLLPTVDGLGALVGGATALLPRVLQEITERVAAGPGPHPVLDAVLQVATGLGVFGPDAAGFEEPARAARLRAMLAPGWLEQQVADPSAVVDAIVAMFAPGALALPAGHAITRTGERLRWAVEVTGATIFAEVGWSGGEPAILVGVADLAAGPVVLGEVRLGFLDGELAGAVALGVDAGPDLAFFRPQAQVALASGALAIRILPLGAAAAANVSVELVPDPQVTLTEQGALELVTAWLVPLVTRFLLPAFGTSLTTPIWANGPTPLAILDGAGIIRDRQSPPVLAPAMPNLPTIALGGLAELANGATIHLTEHLDISAVTADDRLGLRLRGRVEITGEGADSVDVSIRFGVADWLDDPTSGVTVWVLKRDATADPPFAIDPVLSVTGLGAIVSGPGEQLLIRGPIEVGALGGLLFGQASFLSNGQFDVSVTNLGAALEIDSARIALDSGDGDSFVAKVLPKELAAPFDLIVAYRNGDLEIHGGLGGVEDGIQLVFPLDLDIFGVIYLRELLLAGLVRPAGFEAIAAISGNASLGPLAVTVTRVGLRVLFDSSGAHLGFKAPDGFGLSLDASVVRAGGFLLVDEAKGRYVGALQLSVFNKFDLTAIGIATTKRPDGTPGFSLLLLITLQLPVPIPIGYGFFFAGAGGLLGINRGMDTDRIVTGLRAGTADSILFPTDIIRRIDTIVRDLEEAFPPAEGHFLIAPMVLIQWMNPALVTLKLGLVIEIAMPPKIAILGVLRLALPTPDAAVVDLKVAFLGAIDFAAALLSFDAAIYDSYIGYGDFKLSLEGDIAIRVCWGPSPDLVASIGGFHPSYTPAAHLRLPAMRRITLSLLKDNPRISLRLYFAVTSNTIQMGARLELYVGVAGFSITGDLGFDLLVQLVPFLIDAHLWGSLAVRAGSMDICSINLDLRLTGPTPWIARGKAKFSILFISVSVEVEARFGAEQSTTLPAEPILNRLLDVLRDPKSWSAELGGDAGAGVSVIPPAAGNLVIDAAGLLSVRQDLIPLETDIGKVGPVPPADVRRVAITGFAFGPQAAPVAAPYEAVTAGFAPSAFAGAPTSDVDRLRAPAFVPRPAGARARVGTVLAGDLAIRHKVAYERIICDDPDAPTPDAEPALPAVSVGRLISGGAVGSSAAAAQRRRSAEAGRVVAAETVEPRYGVTAVGDLRPRDDAGNVLSATPAGLPEGALLPLVEAQGRLAALNSGGGRFQIVPEVQVAR